VVGLGSIGREVVRRTRAFEMRVLAYDPYVTSAIARDLSVELVSLQDLYAQSDYITVHVSLTSETDHLLNEAAFARMKQGVRIVNCARGELIDEAALQSAIESGKVAGAALDVFAHEPTDATHPLFKLEQVLATPHIGGATEEAKEIVGLRLAEQMMEFLQHGTAINAVNMPSLSPDQHRLVRPFVELSERLGRFAAHMLTGNPISIRMTYFGRIADLNTTLLRNAGLAGVLNRSSSAHANAVNAMQIASEHGWTVAETHDKRSGHADSIRVEIETDSAVTTVEGAVVLGKPRLIQIDGIYCEAPLAGPLVCLKNLDVPGVVGHVGSVLGSNRINIANFSLGRRDSGEPLEAISVVSTDTLVPQEVLDQLMSNPAVKLARSVAVG
jgi:D-3-phosphoglycerate dehydrogenase